MTADFADPRTLRRLDRTIWVLVAAVAAVVLAAPFISSFYLEWRSFAGPAAGALALCAGAWFYRHWRHEQRLASGLECTAQLVAFAAVGSALVLSRCRGWRRGPIAGSRVRRDGQARSALTGRHCCAG